jgi:hypothetical protein
MLIGSTVLTLEDQHLAIVLILGVVNQGVVNAVAESCWLRQLLQELGHPLKKSMVVFYDNVSAAYMFENPVHHQQTKHIEIDLHFVRDEVSLG